MLLSEVVSVQSVAHVYEEITDRRHHDHPRSRGLYKKLLYFIFYYYLFILYMRTVTNYSLVTVLCNILTFFIY